MKNLKRLASLCIALALVLSIAGVNYFFTDARADSYDQAKVNKFTDIGNHWGKNSLANLIGYGYMYGTTPTTAAPDEKLTTAQLVTLLVRIMGGAEEADLSGYVDMDKGAWHYTYFAQGLNMGIVPNTNSNYLNPNQPSSREYAAYMLCRAFGLTVREPLDDYNDADKVSDWAVSSMQAMVAAKAITGSNGGNATRNLNPQETITRAEFAEMVYRLCKNFVQSSDSATIRGGTIDGGVLVSKSGAKFNGTTIKGNVYISDAVGTGDVTFEDVKVEGNIYVRGSGERSVHLEGETTANSVVFLNPYNATRLVVEDEAKINGVLINNGVDEVTLEGKVGNVTMNVSDVDLTLEKAEATNVVINSANSVVSLEEDSVVETLSIASSSSGVTVNSEGKLNRLALMANNAKLNLDGTLDYLLIGAVNKLDLELSKDIVLGALDLHCSDSTIKVDSEVKTINVSAFSEKLKLELGKNAKVLAVGISSASTDLSVASEATVGTVTLDASKYKGTISSDLKTLVIGAGATEAEITLAKDTDIETLTVNGNKVKIITVAGSTVKDINITGKEVTVTGQGAIERVNVSSTADKANIDTPNTKVSNAGASEVKAGTIDLPPNKAYVITSTGKDVIRNNDGTPDGDGDKTTGAAQEVATVANFELAFASGAAANDIDMSGKWSLDDLVTGITLTKNTSGSGATYKLSGNVKKVENFLPVFDPIAGYGTGYYVPVVLSAESMEKETSYEVLSNGTRYTNANLSKGTSYAGKLIVFLQLQSGTTNKIATVSFDRDGAGNAYSPVTVSIDYSGVTFDGAQDLTGELFSYPVNATAADLTREGKLALADFGTYNLIKATDTMYRVEGTSKYIGSAITGNIVGGASATNHYVPVMINTSSFASGWTIVLNGTERFTASNVSTGTGCRGHLVLLLALDETNGSVHTVYMDTDGDGRVDAGGTYTINCTGVGLLPDGSGGNNPGGDDNEPTDFVEIPDYISVAFDVAKNTVTITDNKGGLALHPQEAMRDKLSADYIMSAMNEEGYTKISKTRLSDDQVIFSGTKGDKAVSFVFHCTKGILFVGKPAEIPEGVEVVLPDEGGSVVVYDSKDIYYSLDTSVRQSALRALAVLALEDASYTDCTTDVSNALYATIRAKKDGMTYTFTLNYETGYIRGERPQEPQMVDFTYWVPELGSSAPIMGRVAPGTTVKQFAEMLRTQGDEVGLYYAMNGNGYDAKPIDEDGASQPIAANDVIVYGYYKLATFPPKSVDGGGVRVAIANFDTPAPDSDFAGWDPLSLAPPILVSEERNGEEYYVRGGTEITLTISFTALDSGEEAASAPVEGAKTFNVKAAGATLAFVDNDGFTLSEDKNSVTFANNAGVDSLSLNKDTVTLVTKQGEMLDAFTFDMTYTMSSDVIYTLEVK